MNNELTTLSAESLAKLDGGAVGIAIDKAIENAVADCLDRPSDERKRKITIEVEVVPISRMDESRGRYVCEGAKAIAKVKLGVPVRETGSLSFAVNKLAGGLLFNEESPGNVNQRTFDFTEEAEG